MLFLKNQQMFSFLTPENMPDGVISGFKGRKLPETMPYYVGFIWIENWTKIIVQVLDCVLDQFRFQLGCRASMSVYQEECYQWKTDIKFIINHIIDIENSLMSY